MGVWVFQPSGSNSTTRGSIEPERARRNSRSGRPRSAVCGFITGAKAYATPKIYLLQIAITVREAALAPDSAWTLIQTTWNHHSEAFLGQALPNQDKLDVIISAFDGSALGVCIVVHAYAIAIAYLMVFAIYSYCLLTKSSRRLPLSTALAALFWSQQVNSALYWPLFRFAIWYGELCTPTQLGEVSFPGCDLPAGRHSSPAWFALILSFAVFAYAFLAWIAALRNVRDPAERRDVTDGFVRLSIIGRGLTLFLGYSGWLSFDLTDSSGRAPESVIRFFSPIFSFIFCDLLYYTIFILTRGCSFHIFHSVMAF